MNILYFIRLIIITLYVGIMGIISSIICIIRPFHASNIYMGARLFRWKAFEILGLKLEYENRAIMVDNRPAVIVSNHQSNLDFLLLAKICAPRTVTIGKKSLKYIPIFGIFYWLSGNILIDRQNKKKAFSAMVRAVRTILNKNISVWIFPEGTRSHNKGLLSFKRGAFYTAIRAQVPIIPVCISSFYKNLDFSKLDSGTIKVKVLPPIETAGLDPNIDSIRLTTECENLIRKELEIIDQNLAQ